MKNIPLSIIVPVYNGETYLAAAIMSILRQPCKNFEILVVDDGSKDRSGVIADCFSEQYENVSSFHIPNSGVSAARNYGIRKAKGKYLAFLDADDVLCKDAYTEDVGAVLENEQHDVLSFSYFVSTENLRYGRKHSAEAGLFPRDHQDYLRQTHKHFSSYLYCRNLFAEETRFPEGIRYSEDVAFLFLILRNACQIMQYDQPWFIHRMNAASVMHSIDSSEYILTDVVEVWNWCKDRCATDDDRNQCDGMIFLNMIEYIQYSCFYGVAIDTIMRNIKDNQPFQKAMLNYGHFWTSKEYADLYTDFMRHPHRVWIRNRFVGFFHNFMRRLSWTQIGGAANRVLRYRQMMEEYVP